MTVRESFFRADYWRVSISHWGMIDLAEWLTSLGRTSSPLEVNIIADAIDYD